MSFEWDPAKAEANLAKHGVEFGDVFAVFEDDLAMTMVESGYGEERFVAIGMDGLGRVVVVSYSLLYMARRESSDYLGACGVAVGEESVCNRTIVPSLPYPESLTCNESRV